MSYNVDEKISQLANLLPMVNMGSTPLSKNTVASALALKEILGIIQLESIPDKESDFYQVINGEKKFKLYYITH